MYEIIKYKKKNKFKENKLKQKEMSINKIYRTRKMIGFQNVNQLMQDKYL